MISHVRDGSDGNENGSLMYHPHHSQDDQKFYNAVYAAHPIFFPVNFFLFLGYSCEGTVHCPTRYMTIQPLPSYAYTFRYSLRYAQSCIKYPQIFCLYMV